jgi:uncharacterized protein
VDWKLSIAGLLIGVLVGMTGMGGGSLMTPMLVFLFGFKPTVAIGTDILHGAIFKSFGAVRHRQLGTVHARLTLWMLAASAPLSLVGVALSTWLKHRYGDGFEHAAGIILGIALIAGGIGFGVKTFVRGRAKSDAPFLLTTADRRVALVTGALGGFIVGLTSVGSGTFFGLMMLFVGRAAVGRRRGPSRGRERRPDRDGVAPARVDPGRPARQPGLGQPARPRAQGRPRPHAHPRRPQAGEGPRSGRRHPGRARGGHARPRHRRRAAAG